MAFPVSVLAAFRRTESRGARLSRAGAFRVDVFMMILVIVAVIGAGCFAVFAFDAYDKDLVYVQKMEAHLVLQQSEFLTTQDAARRACEPLGFRDQDGGPSSVQSMYAVQEFASKDVFTVYEGNPTLVGGGGLRYTEPPRDPNTGETKGSGSIVDFSSREVPRPVFSTLTSNLLKLIAHQDDQINKMIDIIERTATLRASESKRIDESVKKREDSDKTINAELLKATDDRDTAMVAKGRDQETAENAETDEAKVAHAKYNEKMELLETERRKVDVVRPTIWDPKEQASKKREAALSQLANRIRSLSNSANFDGHVVQVDNASGWCWISIGQPDNVRPEMSFQIFRPTAVVGSQPKLVGELRIKQVLEGGVSRCRIDALENPDDMPKAGDLLRNPNYSRDQYRIYTFLGRFGAPDSEYTRQQLADVLHRFNKEVLEYPTDRVEVVVLGADWALDPNLEKLLGGVTFETMTEKDLLYMFGISGPDPR